MCLLNFSYVKGMYVCGTVSLSGSLKYLQFVKLIVSEPSAVSEVVRDTAVICSLWC